MVIGLAVGLTVGLGGSGGVPPVKTASLATLGHLTPPPSPGATGPEGAPIPNAPALASTAHAASGATVDQISCSTSEQLAFHVHSHLTIFVNGQVRQVPDGIGIAPPRQSQQTPQGPFVTGGTCLYWLHTHAADGIIHIESPTHRTFTLGEFFDVWGQPLGPDQLGPVQGKVTAFYNGKVFLGNPRDLPLGNHTQIQLDVGTPRVSPESISFPSGL